MSTTFGVQIPGQKNPVPVAHRSNAGHGKMLYKFTNPVAQILPDDTPLIPMDNSAQGITNIGQFRDAALREIASTINNEMGFTGPQN